MGPSRLLTLKNSCPTAPVTPTIANDGPSAVLAACTRKDCRLVTSPVPLHLCCNWWPLNETTDPEHEHVPCILAKGRAKSQKAEYCSGQAMLMLQPSS